MLARWIVIFLWIEGIVLRESLFKGASHTTQICKLRPKTDILAQMQSGSGRSLDQLITSMLRKCSFESAATPLGLACGSSRMMTPRRGTSGRYAPVQSYSFSSSRKLEIGSLLYPRLAVVCHSTSFLCTILRCDSTGLIWLLLRSFVGKRAASLIFIHLLQMRRNLHTSEWDWIRPSAKRLVFYHHYPSLLS